MINVQEKETSIIKTVTVGRIIYYSPDSKWGVFAYANDHSIPELTDAEVKVSGLIPDVYTDSEVEIKGNVVHHPIYGAQIKLEGIKILSSNLSKQGIIEFLTKSSISGIATANATKIYEKFKEDSIEVVLHKTELLKTISGIGEGTYLKIKSSIDKYRAQEKLLNFCNKLGGIPYRVINILHEEFKDSAISILKSNPYKILNLTSSLTFKQVDDIALKLNVPTNHPDRLKYGLLSALISESAFKGSTGCPYPELAKKFSSELGIKDSMTYQATINRLERDNDIKVEFNCVFPTKFYEAERNIANFLLSCVTSPNHRPYEESIVNSELDSFPFELNRQQVNAVYSCLSNRFSIITGAAGSGKTSVTKAIVNILKRHREDVILLSPTGKAAKRLTECTGQDAMTIHRFLGVVDDSLKCEVKKVNARTTILVDEASMMDVLIFSKLIDNANTDTRFILVGDIHQLPSVQAGNILEDIIDSKMFNLCILTDVMRQSEHSNIIKYCTDVNNGTLIQPAKTRDFLYLNFNERDKIIDKLLDLYKRSVDIYGLQETQVICPYKLGDLGIKNLNKIIKQNINKNKDSDKFPFAIGDKVKHNKNNYRKSVFNGETGVVTKIELVEDKYSTVPEDMLTVFYGDREVIYTKSDIHELQLAYASTVHASQGSEYKTVFVILDNEISNILLIRKIIYTALSRAKARCVLLSTGNCVNTAIQNNFYRERITKLGEFLKGEEDNDYFD